MREILFRGKCKFDNKWYYGFLFKDCFIIDSDDENHGEYLDDDNLAWIDTYMKCVDSETVGQYTGLKDKNGTKIFEGDLIKSKYYDIYKVYFEENEFCIEDKWGNALKPIQRAITHFECEVVGNIHDNPELIEE